jgi:hypothetical protein
MFDGRLGDAMSGLVHIIVSLVLMVIVLGALCLWLWLR